MCVYVGAIVRDKRFTDSVLGEVSFVNSATQIAIVDTGRGLSAVPIYMIETIDVKNGGSKK